MLATRGPAECRVPVAQGARAVDPQAPVGAPAERLAPAAGTGGTGGAAGTGGSPTGGVEFDDCGSDADCSVPLACRAMNVGGTVKRCTRLCSMSSQCMTGTRCTYDTGFCAFDDDGKPQRDGTVRGCLCRTGVLLIEMQHGA